MWAKLLKFKWVFLIFCLMAVYLALAWKNPFKQNNLISNVEAFLDIFYYSVPAWNFVRGNGFRMEALDWEIALGVPSFYGMLMIPLFKFFGNFRSYYFLNVPLGNNLIGKKIALWGLAFKAVTDDIREVDGRNIFKVGEMKKLGFNYLSVGR